MGGEAKKNGKACQGRTARQNGKARQKSEARLRSLQAEERGEEWFISWGELRFLTIKICIAIKN